MVACRGCRCRVFSRNDGQGQSVEYDLPRGRTKVGSWRSGAREPAPCILWCGPIWK